MQSCKRSLDKVAKDGVSKILYCLENRDMEGFEKCRSALDAYCTNLDDDQLKEMNDLLSKYVAEMKVDSVYFVRMVESFGDMEVNEQATVREIDEGENALPDTLKF